MYDIDNDNDTNTDTATAKFKDKYKIYKNANATTNNNNNKIMIIIIIIIILSNDNNNNNIFFKSFNFIYFTKSVKIHTLKNEIKNSKTSSILIQIDVLPFPKFIKRFLASFHTKHDNNNKKN